jgi:hypothetical protein
MPAARSLISTVRGSLDEARLRWTASRYRLPGGCRRVYHYHVRKSAGTSLNAAFWALAGLDESAFRRRRACGNGLICVRHAQPLIEEGRYFYGSSHRPAHSLTLPARTFTVTILRDPLKRLLSYYRHLDWARCNPEAFHLEPALNGLRRECEWLGGSFDDFLRLAPREHLLDQLHMFSAEYRVDEAAERVLSCSAVLFTEQFGAGLRDLAGRLSLPLAERHERRFDHAVELNERELDRARELLEPEARLVEQVRRALSSSPS